MPEFATQERSENVVTAIASLVPVRELRTNASKEVWSHRPHYQYAKIISQPKPRIGAVMGGNLARSIPIPFVAPSWQAEVHEPFQSRTLKSRKIGEHVKRVSRWSDDTRAHHAQFETYGLEAYGNTARAWSALRWDVIRPASQRLGGLAVFISAGISLDPNHIVAEGHAAYDTEEETALNLTMAAKEARRKSLRLTDAGADFLLQVLEQTREFHYSGEGGTPLVLPSSASSVSIR